MIRILLVLALLPGAVSLSWAAATIPAPAQDPWYEIELIVFEHGGESAQGARWNGEAGLPALPHGVELTRAPLPFAPDIAEETPSGAPLHSSGLSAFQLLRDTELRLATAMNRLIVSQRYTPLLHVAWRQPVTAEQGFRGVHVHSGLGREEEDAIGDLGLEVAAAPLTGAAPGTLFAAGPANDAEANAVEGLVRLSRSRFLHLNVDLRYRKPGARGESSLFSIFNRQPAATELYRLQQAKRVRSGELQYFDHPRFGAIVLITPFDASARESGLD